jgi:CHASE3 domain sensor protein
MNNHGWGLKVMLGFCGVLALCIIIVAVTINEKF